MPSRLQDARPAQRGWAENNGANIRLVVARNRGIRADGIRPADDHRHGTERVCTASAQASRASFRSPPQNHRSCPDATPRQSNPRNGTHRHRQRSNVHTVRGRFRFGPSGTVANEPLIIFHAVPKTRSRSHGNRGYREPSRKNDTRSDSWLQWSLHQGPALIGP